MQGLHCLTVEERNDWKAMMQLYRHGRLEKLIVLQFLEGIECLRRPVFLSSRVAVQLRVTWLTRQQARDETRLRLVVAEKVSIRKEDLMRNGSSNFDPFPPFLSKSFAEVPLIDALKMAKDAQASGEDFGKFILRLGRESHSEAYQSEALMQASNCTNCGNTFVSDSNFCRRCGEKREIEIALGLARHSKAMRDLFCLRVTLSSLTLLTTLAKEQEPWQSPFHFHTFDCAKRRLELDSWFRIGFDNMQCYAPGDLDIQKVESQSDCRAEAEKVGWEFYQKRKLKSCCEARCWQHYWWTPWGATVDCGGGNLTISISQAEAEAKAA
eukprot:s2586_g13.t1